MGRRFVEEVIRLVFGSGISGEMGGERGEGGREEWWWTECLERGRRVGREMRSNWWWMSRGRGW